jgi:hypothetical protein
MGFKGACEWLLPSLLHSFLHFRLHNFSFWKIVVEAMPFCHCAIKIVDNGPFREWRINNGPVSPLTDLCWLLLLSVVVVDHGTMAGWAVMASWSNSVHFVLLYCHSSLANVSIRLLLLMLFAFVELPRWHCSSSRVIVYPHHSPSFWLIVSKEIGITVLFVSMAVHMPSLLFGVLFHCFGRRIQQNSSDSRWIPIFYG